MPPGWVAAVVILAVLLVLAVGALVWPRSGEEATPTSSAPRSTTTRPEQAGPTTSTTRAPSVPTPSTVPPLGPPPSLAEVQAALDALVPFVEQRRGFPFGTRPALQVVDNTAFDEQIRALFDRHEKVWTQRSLLLQLLGVVDPRVDVVDLFRAHEPIERMAFYDPTRRTVVVRGQRLNPYIREQMVAALVEALDDQRYGIDRPPYDDLPNEVTWGFAALVAGDGVRISDEWVRTLPAAEQAARDRAEQDARVGAGTNTLPPAVIELKTFPVEAGSAFAAAVAKGPKGALDAAFAEPPGFTTSVLHPDRFLGKVPVVAVAAPEVEGQVLASGTFGELMTIAALADVPEAGGRKAAAGWAGDAYVVYEARNGAPCLRVAFKASSPAALEELRRAWTTWAGSHEGAEVSVEGDTLLVNRCISGGRGRSPA